MPNIIGRLLLFLGSYSPLFLICAAVFWLDPKTLPFTYIFIGLFVVGVLGTLLFLKYVKSLNSLPVTLSRVKRKDTEILNYVVAYLIPFVAVIQPEPDKKMIVAFGLFFTFLAWLYIKSNILWINPLLSIMGYHMFEVTNTDETDFTLITKRRNIKASDITVIRIGNEILLEKIDPS